MPAEVDASFPRFIETISPTVNGTMNLYRHSTLVSIAHLQLSHRHLEQIDTGPVRLLDKPPMGC